VVDRSGHKTGSSIWSWVTQRPLLAQGTSGGQQPLTGSGHAAADDAHTPVAQRKGRLPEQVVAVHCARLGLHVPSRHCAQPATHAEAVMLLNLDTSHWVMLAWQAPLLVAPGQRTLVAPLHSVTPVDWQSVE